MSVPLAVPPNFNDMSKDELIDYAAKTYGVTVNKKDKHATLVDALQSLYDTGALPDATPSPEAAPETPKYLRNPVNGGVFEATPYLLGNKDLIPCDEYGN